ncbi:hypothetical protein BKA82DRAFT_168526 [Pisolithus tinctorius]|uniref:3-beta hydroxysteroid dehydrogenase/isomerase domain-containing protein n=1 Tax=Pisolithus tinctorius Marx 270 TaxID=870435 RepID=A0A0C3J9N7_PISTI|nr:hypothetical protein BKA82DRAFT_168526 [Pisolithus tinctorius]KIN94371.1 hypothetical protein M404DRAFT_168526 [Pisolithus tinctorius Marx 270]
MIFGPGDHQTMSDLYQAYQCNQSHIQLGDNNNLFDYTYISYVAQVHLLTAEILVPPPFTTIKTQRILHCTLPPIHATTEYHCMLHSSTQLLGPYVMPPPNAEHIHLRSTSRLTHMNSSTPLSDLVDGQAFSITSGESVYFWDISRACDDYEQ